jgi:hypothetical protein
MYSGTALLTKSSVCVANRSHDETHSSLDKMLFYPAEALQGLGTLCQAAAETGASFSLPKVVLVAPSTPNNLNL